MTGTSDQSTEDVVYEIRVRGHLDSRWAVWFEGLRLTHDTTAPLRCADGSSTKPHPTACSRGSATPVCHCSRSCRSTL